MWQEIDGRTYYDLASAVADTRELLKSEQKLSKFSDVNKVHKFDYLLTVWGIKGKPYLKAEIKGDFRIRYYLWEDK